MPTDRKYLNAASACIARVNEGKPAKLAPEARTGMVAELRAVGILVARRSDAYVASRYDAEWSEGDHPRGEHGMCL